MSVYKVTFWPSRPRLYSILNKHWASWATSMALPAPPFWLLRKGRGRWTGWQSRARHLVHLHPYPPTHKVNKVRSIFAIERQEKGPGSWLLSKVFAAKHEGLSWTSRTYKTSQTWDLQGDPGKGVCVWSLRQTPKSCSPDVSWWLLERESQFSLGE